MNDTNDDISHLKFPAFEDIKVSTKTFIVMTNISFILKELYETLPIVDYVFIPTKRGRKKKCEKVDPNKDIIDGSIIKVEFESNYRGVELKKKVTKRRSRGNYFRNSVTVVIIVENKKVNMKISRNGQFQVTGCKSTRQLATAIKFLWNIIRDNQSIYTYKNGDRDLTVTFIPAMRNIDFSLGFNVDREKLDDYINTKTIYNSLLETSFGYTGVNIKMILDKDINELNLNQMKYINGEWKEDIVVPFSFYLNTLTPKEVEKKLKKNRYNTFLVFHSGRCILSGISSQFQISSYYKFIEIVKKSYGVIKEKLDV